MNFNVPYIQRKNTGCKNFDFHLRGKNEKTLDGTFCTCFVYYQILLMLI